jgi:hypothetical protein
MLAVPAPSSSTAPRADAGCPSCETPWVHDGRHAEPATHGPLLAAEINALPNRVRGYIHDLETRYDPSGDVRSLACARENIEALTVLLRERGAAPAPRQPSEPLPECPACAGWPRRLHSCGKPNPDGPWPARQPSDTDTARDLALCACGAGPCDGRHHDFTMCLIDNEWVPYPKAREVRRPSSPSSTTPTEK